MKLVIVESPAKCNTIQRYLGTEYLVKASLGHIRDLSTKGKGGLGVDIDNNFTPTYSISKDKANIVRELQSFAKKADEVILATDPDREGEAIAWHLANVLGLDVYKNKRLEFHEITRDSITNALSNPRVIDLNLVSSQETRRIMDRIIGFKLSNLLYKKIKSRSAGRVQSATLKIIADKDREIAQFVPEEYWNVLTSILINNKEFKLSYKGPKGKEIKIKNEKEAKAIFNEIPSKLRVISVKKSVKTLESHSPFKTSTLQQEAFNKLKFKTGKTQFVAQSLYEGIEIAGEHVGLITYMRTDSMRLSPTFIMRANNYIQDTFGKEYLGRIRKENIGVHDQDAHEAIRPTSNHRTPESVKPYLTTDQYNLYKLIYNRAVSSLMAPKKQEVMAITLEGNGHQFTLEGSKTLFKGFEILYKDEEEKEYDGNFPLVHENDEFDISNKEIEQKFTQPPTHYSEAKLVKTMEELGIGRPSTYASTIDLIKKRKYVEDKGGILTITEQGGKTSHVLEKYFPDFVDSKYTANMETRLDEIEEGRLTSLKMLKTFNKKFMEDFDKACKLMYVDDVVFADGLCPKCGSPLIYRESKNGSFIGCSNYPSCRYIKKEDKVPPVETGKTCPKCGKPLVERQDKKGHKFVACSGFPNCDYIEQEPQVYTEESYVKKCPKCGGYLVKKKGKYGSFLGCTNYPTCKYMEKIYKKKRK